VAFLSGVRVHIRQKYYRLSGYQLLQYKAWHYFVPLDQRTFPKKSFLLRSSTVTDSYHVPPFDKLVARPVHVDQVPQVWPIQVQYFEISNGLMGLQNLGGARLIGFKDNVILLDKTSIFKHYKAPI
jgi:hypothetical protein